jgi:phosphatidylglycerol---prolipoprotein diacylglyceryl transferase
MLAVLNHPRLIYDWFSTTLLRWADGLVIYDRWLINFSGVQEWTRGGDGTVILDFYYFCYLIAFVGVLMWFRHFRRIGWIKVKPHVPYDALLLAMVGVLVGAKTAYIFIYNPEFYFGPPPYGPTDTGDQLQRIFLNWSGMSSHGAVTGIVVMVFGYWLWTKRKAPAMHIGDIGCISGAFGAIWIRLANFMNGELYGRAAPDWLPWAMRFPVRSGKGNLVEHWNGTLYERIRKPIELQVPEDATDPAYLEQVAQNEKWVESLREANPDKQWGVFEYDNYVMYKNPEAYHQDYQLMSGGQGSPEFLDPGSLSDAQNFDILQLVTTPRHPSQIYQLLLEGVILLLFLLWFRRRVKRSGMVAAAFFTGYPLMRFIGEFFRQPDVQFQQVGNEMGTVFLGLSMGQLLSLAMASVGLGFLFYFSRKGDVIADMKEWPPDKPRDDTSHLFMDTAMGSTSAGDLGGLPEIREQLRKSEQPGMEERDDTDSVEPESPRRGH